MDSYNCVFQTKISCLHGFSEYRYLKEHVRIEHPEIGEALRRLLPEIEKENEAMLPNAGQPQQRGKGGVGGGSNRGGGGGGNTNALPYLNADMLSTQPKEARILMVRSEPQHRFGPSVVVKLALEGKTVLWTLQINNNPNFGILLHQFGKDENEWVDKRILLILEQDEFTETYNIRTKFPPKQK